MELLESVLYYRKFYTRPPSVVNSDDDRSSLPISHELINFLFVYIR